MSARRELIAAIVDRYRNATRTEKTRIVDELVEVTGHHRKHALRVLSGKAEAVRKGGTRARVYDEATREALVVLWEAADRMCGKRLVVAVPGLLEAMERHGHLSLAPVIRDKVLTMSASTMDRLLGAARRELLGGRRRRRSDNHAIKRQVPVRTFADRDDVRPGFFEADFVVHSGGSMKGSPIHSFVLTDVCSGWTEAVPLIVREQSLVVEALRVLQQQSPVALIGLDTDNDSAFMNETLIEYCKATGIEQTRARAHHKNDQAWVEQKNGAIVRRLVGYDRFEGTKATRVLARLYGVARLYVNFFQPSFKLKDKVREGAKVKKIYYRPATPCDRLLAHDDVAEDVKKRLREQRAALDPVHLLHMLRQCQASLAQLAGRAQPGEDVSADLEVFLRGLPQLWRSGEVRPTHRKKPTPARTWRTRKDPFEAVWKEACRWLRQHPDGTGRQLFDVLCLEHPDEFSPGQLRTLQRRVQEWRSQMARSLILPGQPQGAVDEWLTNQAAE